MQQSNAIFAAVFIAYVIFITMRGELPAYIDLLRGGGAAPSGKGIAPVTDSAASAPPVATNGPAAYDSFAAPPGGLIGDAKETLKTGKGPLTPKQAKQVIELFGYE